ncbi:MAG: hypothetical protein PHO15_01340 [Eubacteriales bacterium]|nr:hypothetical protein [Eubacteriales bacterium]
MNCRKNLDTYIALAKSGTKIEIDTIMSDLNADMTIAVSKIIDYALSFVKSKEGLEHIKYYLFNGTQIQRNYCTLFFNRRGDWPLVKAAYEKGLIDEIQAFSR